MLRSRILVPLALGGAICASAFAADPCHFIWSGGVTDSTAIVASGLTVEADEVEVIVDTDPEFPSPTVYRVESGPEKTAKIKLSRLTPDTEYFYKVRVDGSEDDFVGRLKTFPAGASDFRFTFGSCSSTGSTSKIFDIIREENPLFHLITGDFHYEDIAVNDPELFKQAYQDNFDSPKWDALLKQMPIAYIWDDHDYGPNNSDKTSPSREAARLAYREWVPHYETPNKGPIYQSFDVGRATIILLDLRSERDPRNKVDNSSKSMMGAKQKSWFKNELLKAKNRLVIVVSSVPWISKSKSDTWFGYSTERMEIARFIVENNLQDNLCMLAGDAHMLAIDDGSNNTYAGAEFPVFHAAALDRNGSKKGGPYTSGTYPGGGQYGLVEIFDNGGDHIDVKWFGKNRKGEVVIAHKFSVPAPSGM